MNDPSQRVASDDELAALRDAADLPALIDALVRRGATALEQADWALAQRDLDEAATVAELAGKLALAAQAHVAVATALRGDGQLAAATARAEHAVALAPDGPPRIAALTALGECHRAAGSSAAAEAAYAEALTGARAAHMLPFHQAALLRRRAEALRSLGRIDEATAALTAAIDAYRGIGADEPLRDTLVERAAALVDAAAPAWTEAIAAGRTAAAAVGDHARLAELAVLEATRATAAGDVAAAISWAERARQHALDGDSPITYTAAAIAIADLKERTGDRVGAYASLAVGWVTLGDVLGQDTAAAWFRPQLLAARERWGEAGFQAAKDAYYATLTA